MNEIHIVFDGLPGPEGPRFIEVEDEHGQGICVGEWQARPDGYYALVIPVCPKCQSPIAEDRQ